MPSPDAQMVASQTAPAMQPPTDNPQPEFKPKKKSKFNPKLLLGLVVLVLVGVGLGSVYFLSQTSQDVRQQASTGTAGYTTACCVLPTGLNNWAGPQSECIQIGGQYKTQACSELCANSSGCNGWIAQ